MNVPSTPHRSKIAGRNPTVHHLLSLTAAQRNDPDDARLSRRSGHANKDAEGAQTDLEKALTQRSMTHPAITAASPATPSLCSFAHKPLIVM